MFMSTFLSRHDNISTQMSSLLDGMRTSGFQATPSTGLIEQMPPSFDIPVIEEVSKGQVGGDCFVTIDTPKDLELTQQRLSRTRSSNDLSSQVAKYAFSKRQQC